MADSQGLGGGLTLLVCRVGSRMCGVPLQHVLETMRPLPVEPLSHMPGFVDGLSLIRGRPTPVLDAGRLLGANGHESARTRYVRIKLGERTVALAVDAVLGVRTLDVGTLTKLPALLQEAQGELVAALGTLDAELLLVLEHTRLLPESVWKILDVEARPT